LTPAQLVFELPRGRKFCHERIDADTYVIIGKVMAAIMEEHNLVLTQDDVLLCFLRFRELIFLYEATRQGVMLTKVTENSIDYYYVDGDEKTEDAEPETAVKYVKHMKHYHGGII
jgi:hypothetical protein